MWAERVTIMTNFTGILVVEDGQTNTPFAGMIDGQWVGGTMDVEFLQDNFGQYSTAQEMIDATGSAGLKLFFGWLKDQGILN
jgi:hypothetical protein